MSNSYYEKGANHYDHHKELHIDTVNGGDIGKLISAFFKDDAEDAVIVGEEKSSDNESRQDSSVDMNSIPNDNNNTLSANRQAILDHLLDLADKGDWVNGITSENVKAMLKTVLGLGKSPLTGKEAEMSETLWKLLESGRGERLKVTWQNMIGYYDDRHLLKQKSAPALNMDFFGNKDGSDNINKGRPSRDNMSSGFREVLPLLDAYVPKLDKKA